MEGSDPTTVRRALDSKQPLPGTGGFAGELDGALVRDVLGRYPIFSEADDPMTWSFDHRDLDSPDFVPAGCKRTADGDEQVWTLPEPPLFESGPEAVSAVGTAVETRLAALPEETPVAFSGGVDSAALGASLDGPLYVTGFPESHDVAAARSAARILGKDLTVVEITHERLEAAIPAVARAIGRTNPMDVGIALPLYLTAKRAAADGYDTLAVGQGADELFGGYEKVIRADHRVEATTVRGAAHEVIATLPDQLARDVLAIRAASVEPIAPLLHDDVVEASLRLPGDLLVSPRGERKFAFRLAVREWTPDPIAFREKKAVQYGSLVARELDRLARQAGFKKRMDDHVGQYVESLL
ncbi:asparagine synthase C-terminal domain-containing protein [Haladaptatus sp. GCM10025707]|uniref:asparagine synthase C-terminal domain-containing protein n=1 Tax=unclassified Haladaptatus TaxID=2622732 RepID=UPI0023E7825A|nr:MULTISPECIES: asparagine synthase-related protein [unclassified Haladaptatus]